MALYLGLAQWLHPDWASQIGGRGLHAYAEQFNSVEGGSTFYALPDVTKAASWAASVTSDFRFCFKFPKRITHDLMLQSCVTEVKDFFRFLGPLERNLGPLMIQLPLSFTAANLPALRVFLDGLPIGYQYVVEFRHTDFFDRDEVEKRVNQVLAHSGADRVWFDSRNLFSRAPSDDAEREAQSKKPRMPVFGYSMSDHPVVRFMTNSSWQAPCTAFDQWVLRVSEWLEQGKNVYFFAHTPSNAEAPKLAARFQDAVSERCSLVEPFSWRPGSAQDLF